MIAQSFISHRIRVGFRVTVIDAVNLRALKQRVAFHLSCAKAAAVSVVK